MIGLLLAAHLYTVKAGDTLFGIVGNRWPTVCQENRIPDCNLIYPGQVINTEGWSNDATTASYSAGTSDRSNGLSSGVSGDQSSLAGTLSCSGLESLWISAGGNPGSAFIAAEIAMAESGGQQYATGAAGEESYWQINPVNGDASYNPYLNARAAIAISDNGSNWSAWTTYTEGLYYGRC